MNNYDAEADQSYSKFLGEKEDRLLKEAVLTEEILRACSFYLFDLENLEGNYIEDYDKTSKEIDLASSQWAVNDLVKTGKPLPGIDPRTGVYGPVIASMGFTHAGNDYSDIDECEKAIANFTKAIELNPWNTQAYLGRGVVRCHLEDFEQAAYEDLREAVDLNPIKLAENNKQSRAVLKMLDAESMHDLMLCLIESLNARGIAFLKAGMPDKALESLNEAIKYAPDNYDLYVHRASAYTKLKKYQEAIADYDKKLSVEPGSAVEYINRAFCYSKLYDKQHAFEDAEIAVQLDPSNKDVRRCRDNIYRELEKYEKAIAASK